ncbi:MAG: methylated-DNA--[Clostridia bacterium]|nr:methylated-DNA--[protein]-cysteine S-methyltransferase [Clostridia bacterium]
MDYINHYSSPLGEIILASDGEALTGLWFAGQQYEGSTLAAEHGEKDLPVFDETRRWLDVYFTGKVPGFTPPLRLRGTDFRKTVWEVLLTIPFGKTVTYGEIAAQIARETGGSVSARAVGGAVGRNPISLIVPCHRVLGANGSLTGYAGGVERKEKLLEMERSGSTAK